MRRHVSIGIPRPDPIGEDLRLGRGIFPGTHMGAEHVLAVEVGLLGDVGVHEDESSDSGNSEGCGDIGPQASASDYAHGDPSDRGLPILSEDPELSLVSAHRLTCALDVRRSR